MAFVARIEVPNCWSLICAACSTVKFSTTGVDSPTTTESNSNSSNDSHRSKDS